MRIVPAQNISGSIELPGDKSISHRTALLGAIAKGTSRVSNFLTADDCMSTIECIRSLGVDVRQNGTYVEVDGRGLRGLIRPDAPLDCGNSGTTARLIAGILAGQHFDSTLTGDASLSNRPMKRIIDPLAAMGAMINSRNDRLPLSIRGGRNLKGIQHTLEPASAQVKSCILLAALYAEGSTTIFEPTPTRDHTERMLSAMGVNVVTSSVDAGKTITIDGGATPSAIEMSVPSDISSAAFFIVAAVCLEGSIRLNNVGLNPTRTGVLGVMRRLGADISIENEHVSFGEPIGDLIVSGKAADSPEGTNDLNGKLISNIIDEIPILAVLGTQLKGGIEVRAARELRVKETDRIAAVVTNLRKMGAAVDEYDDGFRVYHSRLKGAKLDSFGDHRIAMAFAVAGSLADGETVIGGGECASISFPGFFDTFKSVVR